MSISFCFYFLQISNPLDDTHLTEGESFSLVFSIVHAYPSNLEITLADTQHCFLRFLAVLASFPVAIIKHPDENSLGEKGSFSDYSSCTLLLSSLSPFLYSSVSCSGNDATHSGWVFPLIKVKSPQLCPQVNLIQTGPYYDFLSE